MSRTARQGVANILWALAKLQQHAEFQDKDAKEVVQVVFSLQARVGHIVKHYFSSRGRMQIV